MKKILLFTASIFTLLAAKPAQAQMVGTADCFIKGDYVQVGISNSGAFGACFAPAGYFPNGIPGSRTLGFVSDPDKDGWLVSAPGKTSYMGDYFVPGSPYEAWDIEFGGTKYSSNNCPSGGTLGSGSSYGHTSYLATATEQTNVWSGTIGSLNITQKTVVRKDRLYFVMYIDIVNTGTTTVNNVYYQRAVDPDNEQPWSGNFVTNNKVVYQPNSISKNCLVTAEGPTYGNFAYLGLGTKDCRARCYILNGGLSSGLNLSTLFAGTGAASGNYYNVGATYTNDVGYGLVFSLGNLAAGQRTSLAYTYILKQADLDSALGETAPKFESGGVPYSPYTTFRVCPGRTVKLKVVNGGQYQWIWTTTTAPTYMAALGTSTAIAAGGTIPTVTGSKVYPTGAVQGDSIEVTVYGPKTYTATGYSNCDTQLLVFYVDTISFSTPPSVVSPVLYCEGATASPLTAGAASAATLHWYFPMGTPYTGPGTSPTPSTTFPASATTDFDTTSYYVTQSNPAGCETPPAKINVIVTRKPAPPTVRDTVYCQGDPTKPLIDFVTKGSGLRWYDAAGVRFPSIPTPSSASPTTINYLVSQTLNGCESDKAPQNVVISGITAGLTVMKDSLCGSEPLIAKNTSATTTPTYTSLWSFGDGGTRNDSNVSHSYADKRGSYTVTLDVTNIYGCKATTSKVIEVFKEPVMTVEASATKICQGDAVDFTGTATPGYSGLTWDFGDKDPAYNSLKMRHAFTQSGVFNVQLQGTYPACPGIAASVVVDVVPIPNVNLGNDTGFCPGNTVLTLRNLSGSAADKYVWNTGDTSATIAVRNAGQYSVRAENWQCSASDSITISKACYLDVPNAFSPGSGTDYNNYFLPRELLAKSAVTFTMQIFDRWGQLLFESDKVNGRGWDGNYKGQAMPMGVYVYMIRVSFANGVSESYNGNVTLVR